MKKYGKKGFTLIELISVLVIMAIIALIVTPLVMSIIRKSKISARKRSVDAYGRSVELAIASYLLDTGTFPTDLHSLTIEYSGNTVVCNVMTMKENGGLYMSECSVNNVEVKDDSTEDGWYHYGTRDITNEEYVDMYGKNVDAALKLYHDTNDAYPESIDTLTIESVGKTVACESSINYDGTVYLTNCKVNGVSVVDNNQEDGYYHYGTNQRVAYSIGDIVTYNDIDYYVIKDSGVTESIITLLKAEPLTVDEVNLYGAEHVNRYTLSSIGTASNQNGYGGSAYYSNTNCGKVETSYSTTGCISEYEQSDIKYIINSWAQDKTISNDLSADSTGYGVRLITINELQNNLGYGNSKYKTSNTPTWVYKINDCQFGYWTMSPIDQKRVWAVNKFGNLDDATSGSRIEVRDYNITIRPVITIKKSAL